MPAGTLIVPALESAVAELQRQHVRFEAYARLGESDELRYVLGPGWSRRYSRQVGVACRIATLGRRGFGAAAGSAPRAGRDAARAALAALAPGSDPIPPRHVLGVTPVGPAPLASPLETVNGLGRELEALFDTHDLTLHELRLVEGGSTSSILTGEGFAATATLRGAVVEVVLAAGGGPPRHHHVAARRLADIDVPSLAYRIAETTRLVAHGGPPRRRLTDVAMAPAVAAPLILALAQKLCRGDRLVVSSPSVSRAWALFDHRPGPAGLAPLPFDGEGLPARSLRLIADGALGQTYALWEDAGGVPAAAGGATRPSYRRPPYAGPANLVVEAPVSAASHELLDALDDGCYMALPIGSPKVDNDHGVVTLLGAGTTVHKGRHTAAHSAIEVSVSFRRLLSNLEAAGTDPQAFSLAAAITTPSLLFRRLEVR